MKAQKGKGMKNIIMKKFIKKKNVLLCCILLAGTAIAVLSKTFSTKAEPYYADIEQFPNSYKDALYKLKEKHPNWIFRMYDTGLEWDTVLYNEMNPASRSLIPSYFDSSMVGAYYGDGWACATQLAVEYYMDPRNWLTEDYIFQFEQLSYNADTQGIVTVQRVLTNTFMSGYIEGYESMGLTYAQAFSDIGKAIGVSPVHLATRVYQEQGAAGKSDLISGVYPGFEGYYNYYNIQASGVTHEEIVRNGLNEAKSEGWNNRYSALYGGSKKVSDRYILRGQDTLYLQKFDVDDTYDGRYWHQYMQNLCAPSNEGRRIKQAYERAGMLEATFIFEIPVYRNMPYQDGFVEIDGKYYLYKSGTMVKGEYQFEGVWYYFDPQTGEMARNRTIVINDKTYCYDKEGKKVYGIGYAQGYWYRCDTETGAVTESKYAGDLFIAEDYAAYNPDVASAYGNDTAKLLEHWLNVGIYEGRSPSRLYDPNYYKNAYGDKAAAAGTSAEIVAGSFALDGMKNGYSGSEGFNVMAYLTCNPDLYSAFGLEFADYYRHYLDNFRNESRIHTADQAGYSAAWIPKVLFDPAVYAENNQDIRQAFGDDADGLFRHWLKYGIYEGRIASRVFDPKYYLQNNDDVIAVLGDGYVSAVFHFYQYGMSEMRTSHSEFDAYGYMIMNADLLLAFGGDASRYYIHYSDIGYSENREIERVRNRDWSLVFNRDYYYENNQDIADAYENRDDVLSHFLAYGMSEGRAAAEGFDVNVYKENYGDLRDAFGDNLKLYYIHYINYGHAEGRTAVGR